MRIRRLSPRRRTLRFLAGAIFAAVLVAGCAREPAAPELRFSIDESDIRNEFLRDGPVAAHVVLKSAAAPRLIVAFPAGNSGVGVWFAQQDAPVAWAAAGHLEPQSRTLADGSVRHGVRFETAVDAGRLELRRAILSNVRVLRDYRYTGQVPAIVEAEPVVDGRTVTWERRRLDNGAGYFLSIEVLNGNVQPASTDTPLAFVAAAGENLQFRVTALTGDTPLTGIPIHDLLSDTAGADQRLRNVLAFLAYEEKFLAGSWRFDTYFGRDTLMTLALLGDALTPAAREAAFGAVLDRLSATGEVAHEEDIAEYALLRHRADGVPDDDSPIFDYKMIDDDFMLAPVLAQYLLDTPESIERADAFLSRQGPHGATYRELLRRNLAYVVDAVAPYGDVPNAEHLVAVRSVDPPVGNWRDSRTGLGGGMYPYDVNVALVPAALAAAIRLAGSGLLGDDADGLAEEAGRLAAIWSSTAGFFDVTEGAIAFPALALDADGEPIPVMHSDVGYTLLFGEPAESGLEEAAELILRPYPDGLMTPAGMLVSNARYAPESVQAVFGPDRYHGAVIWSWQQALMAEGLERQLGRTDVSAETRERLTRALDALRRVIDATAEYRSAELWSWKTEHGRIVPVPFGQQAGDETESNAAQLWSTVFLGQ